MTLFADVDLAARLEGFCADEMHRFTQTAHRLDPESGACVMEVGGGVAGFVAPGSPVNHAVGLGFEDPVGADEIDAVERFYRQRGAQPFIGVCPLAHPSLVCALGARGWIVDGFENVLVRECGAEVTPPSSEIEIREAESDDDKDLWKLVAATGFSDPLPPLAAQLALADVVVNRPGSTRLLAFVDGKAAGTGELYCASGVAWLSADTTLPQFRRKGVQTALQRHRLRLGAEAGCELAATEAAPGSLSQRNMERLGFKVAYTRVDMMLA